jgi:2'-5' RNA ligase
MGLGRNLPRRLHKTAGVMDDGEDYAAPGTRVIVKEGFLGTVTDVHEGPGPGADTYIVELDGGMGGGQYGGGEFRLADEEPTTAAKTASAPNHTPAIAIGERVVVEEGVTGTVEDIDEGPGPGAEMYRIVLDGSMGSGEWSLGEIQRVALHPADCSACGGSGTQPSGHECYICDGTGSAKAEAEGRAAGETNANPENGLPVGTDMAQTAASDYPELAEILVERPPLAHVASKMAFTETDEDEPVWQVCAEGHVTDGNGMCKHEPVVTGLTYAEGLERRKQILANPVFEEEPDDGLTDLGRTLRDRYSMIHESLADEEALVPQGWVFFRVNSHRALDGLKRHVGVEPVTLVSFGNEPVYALSPEDWAKVEAHTGNSTKGVKRLQRRPDLTDYQRPMSASKEAARFVVVDATGATIAGPFKNSDLARQVIDQHTDEGLYIAATPDYQFQQAFASKESGVLDNVIDWAAEKAKVTPQNNWSYDWCRFRKHERCMFPKELDEQGTREAGYSVWIPEDRGWCPRQAWDAQKACPVGEPGPKSGDPNAKVDATVSWEEGGQRRQSSVPVEITVKATEDDRLKPHAYVPQGVGTWRTCAVCGLGANSSVHRKQAEATNTVISPAEPVEEQGMACAYCMGIGYGGVIAVERAEGICGKCRGRGYNDARFVTGSANHDDNEWGFHFHAAWKDVQTKATRIRGEGHVRIVSATSGYVTAEVRGDTNIYQCTVMRTPGSKAASMWECGCAWSNYSWARSGRWKKYEGRMCSHALATLYEAQAREMFGETITEDRSQPQWRSDPTLPVVRPGDTRTKPSAWRVGSMGDGEPHLVSTEASLARSLGETIKAEAGFVKDLKALVRGTIRKVIDIIPGGKALVDGLGEISTREVLYPTYHPTKGLEYRPPRTAAKAAAKYQKAFDGYNITTKHGDTFMARKTMEPLNGVRGPWWTLVASDSSFQVQKRAQEQPDYFASLADLKQRVYEYEGDAENEFIGSLHLAATEANMDGAMVAIVPPQEVLEALAVEGGEPIDNMHFTVAYLGNRADLDLDRVEAAIAAFAMGAEPLSGRIGGYGVFHNEDAQVLVALGDFPGLAQWRVRLLDYLSDAGIEIPSDHDFTPHMTLAYVAEGDADVPTALPDGLADITFDSFVLAYGPDWTTYPMGEHEPVLGEQKAAAGQTCPNCGHSVSRHDTLGQCWECECDRYVIFASKTATDKQDPRFEGVGLKQDDDGWYVHTHRARSDSYPSPEAIPQDDVDYIESTGSLHTAVPVEDWPPRPEWGEFDGNAGVLLWVDQAGNVHGEEVGDPSPFSPLFAPWFGYEHEDHFDEANLFEAADSNSKPTGEPSPIWDGADDERHDAETPEGGEHLGPKDECPLCPKTATNDEARDWDMDPALRDDSSWLLDAYPVLEPITVDEARAAYAESMKHDEPEPALPVTDGAEDDEDLEDPREVRASLAPTTGSSAFGVPADVQLPAWLGGSGDSGSSRVAQSKAANSDIAQAAKAFLEGGMDALTKQGAKVFSQAEQQAIIGEGEGERAGNLDRLDLTGTHYGPLGDALDEIEATEEDWLL